MMEFKYSTLPEDSRLYPKLRQMLTGVKLGACSKAVTLYRDIEAIHDKIRKEGNP
jgi:hypothetical protein